MSLPSPLAVPSSPTTLLTQGQATATIADEPSTKPFVSTASAAAVSNPTNQIAQPSATKCVHNGCQDSEYREVGKARNERIPHPIRLIPFMHMIHFLFRSRYASHSEATNPNHWGRGLKPHPWLTFLGTRWKPQAHRWSGTPGTKPPGQHH